MSAGVAADPGMADRPAFAAANGTLKHDDGFRFGAAPGAGDGVYLEFLYSACTSIALNT